jgi:hypothetical protein
LQAAISLHQNSIFEQTRNMTTTTIRKKLVAWVQVADAKKIKALYTLLVDEINTAENDWDEDFVEELNRRSKGITDGTAKTYTWEETKAAASVKLNVMK